MLFLEVCQQVINKKVSESENGFQYGIWRGSWPQDTILGFNEKKDAYASSPGVSIFLDSIRSRCVVLSLSSTYVSFVGWLPSVEDLSSTDWESNIPKDQP